MLLSSPPPLGAQVIENGILQLRSARPVTHHQHRVERFLVLRVVEIGEEERKRCSQGIFPAVARAGMMRRHEHGSFQS